MPIISNFPDRADNARFFEKNNLGSNYDLISLSGTGSSHILNYLISYKGSIYAARSNNGTFKLLDDNTWEKVSNRNLELTDIRYFPAKDVFFAGGMSTIYKSDDGINWKSFLNNLSPNYNTGFFNGILTTDKNLVVFSCNESDPASSMYNAAYTQDLVNWVDFSVPTGYYKATASGNGICLAAAGYINLGNSCIRAEETDLSNWIEVSLPVEGCWTDLVYGNGLFLLIASGNTTSYLITEDGLSWVARTLPGNAMPKKVKFGNGKFIMFTDIGIMVSDDGINWNCNYFDSSLTINVNTISFCSNGKFFDINNNNDTLILVSSDSIPDKSQEYRATLVANRWIGDNAPYTYEFYHPEIMSITSQDISPSTDISSEQLQALQEANIIDGGQFNGYVLLKAFGNKPSIDIPIKLVIKGVK